MICWAVEAQVLQIRNEVRDGALVYALTLTEDVKLKNKRRIIKIQQIPTDSLTANEIQASHLIKHLKELGTGLMNRTDDCPSPLSQRLHKRNNLETGRAVQTAAKPHKEVRALIRTSVEIPQIHLE